MNSTRIRFHWGPREDGRMAFETPRSPIRPSAEKILGDWKGCVVFFRSMGVPRPEKSPVRFPTAPPGSQTLPRSAPANRPSQKRRPRSSRGPRLLNSSRRDILTASWALQPGLAELAFPASCRRPGRGMWGFLAERGKAVVRGRGRCKALLS